MRHGQTRMYLSKINQIELLCRQALITHLPAINWGRMGLTRPDAGELFAKGSHQRFAPRTHGNDKKLLIALAPRVRGLYLSNLIAGVARGVRSAAGQLASNLHAG